MTMQSQRDDVAKSTTDVAESAGAGHRATSTGMSNGRGSAGRIGGGGGGADVVLK